MYQVLIEDTPKRLFMTLAPPESVKRTPVNRILT